MRVAAIYDVHGNLPALEAVLEEVRGLEIEHVVVGGDVVPGPMPAACLAELDGLSMPVSFIHGNGESAVLTYRRGEELTRVPEPYHGVIHWAADALSSDHLAAFATWPLTARLTIDGLGEVVFCHATPRDDNEIFTAITPVERLLPVVAPAAADVLICGHTHMQFDRRVGDTRVLNAGSVGMPFGEPGAYWALLGPDGVELRHTPYDYAAAAKYLGTAGYPSEFEVETPAPAAQMLELFERATLPEPSDR